MKPKREFVWVVEARDTFWPKDTWSAVGRTFYGSRSEAMTHVRECRAFKEPHMEYRSAKYVREG